MDCIVNDPDPFFAPVCGKLAGLWSRANHALSDWYELLWNVLAWTVIATALVLTSTGTARSSRGCSNGRGQWLLPLCYS